VQVVGVDHMVEADHQELQLQEVRQERVVRLQELCGDPTRSSVLSAQAVAMEEPRQEVADL
jgi:hypothetical protein